MRLYPFAPDSAIHDRSGRPLIANRINCLIVDRGPNPSCLVLAAQLVTERPGARRGPGGGQAGARQDPVGRERLLLLAAASPTPRAEQKAVEAAQQRSSAL